jgi:hypothetical protein
MSSSTGNNVSQRLPKRKNDAFTFSSTHVNAINKIHQLPTVFICNEINAHVLLHKDTSVMAGFMRFMLGNNKTTHILIDKNRAIQIIYREGNIYKYFYDPHDGNFRFESKLGTRSFPLYFARNSLILAPRIEECFEPVEISPMVGDAENMFYDARYHCRDILRKYSFLGIAKRETVTYDKNKKYAIKRIINGVLINVKINIADLHKYYSVWLNSIQLSSDELEKIVDIAMDIDSSSFVSSLSDGKNYTKMIDNWLAANDMNYSFSKDNLGNTVVTCPAFEICV